MRHNKRTTDNNLVPTRHWLILQALFGVAVLGWGYYLVMLLLPRLGLMTAQWGIGSRLGMVELWAWAAFSFTLLVIVRGLQLVAAERQPRLATLPVSVDA